MSRIAFFAFFIILLVTGILGAWLWTYTLNTWLLFFGKPTMIVWWQGALLGMAPFTNAIMIPAALITWILFLFLA